MSFKIILQHFCIVYIFSDLFCTCKLYKKSNSIVQYLIFIFIKILNFGLLNKIRLFLKEQICTKSALSYFFIYTFCTSTLYLYIKPSSHFVQCTKKSKKKIGFFCTLCFFRKPYFKNNLLYLDVKE